jgi:hypothetical protein
MKSQNKIKKNINKVLDLQGRTGSKLVECLTANQEVESLNLDTPQHQEKMIWKKVWKYNYVMTSAKTDNV